MRVVRFVAVNIFQLLGWVGRLPDPFGKGKKKTAGELLLVHRRPV